MKATENDLILVQNTISELTKSQQKILNPIFGTIVNINKSLVEFPKKESILDQLIIDEKFVTKNSVSDIIKKLEPGICQSVKNYQLDVTQPQIGTIAFDATYLSSYSRKLKDGSQSGTTEVKQQTKKQLGTGRPRKAPIKNMFLFMLTLLNSNYPTFITCVLFCTNGSASYLTDKIVTALV